MKLFTFAPHCEGFDLVEAGVVLKVCGNLGYVFLVRLPDIGLAVVDVCYVALQEV